MTTPERKIRCRFLDRLRNPCPNEQLTDLGLCLDHLQKAHAEYEALLEQVRHPIRPADDVDAG